MTRPTRKKTADKLVDDILKKLFNIPGICSSRLAFCVETSPGIKDIAISDISGKNVMKVTGNNTLCVEPEWTPDGKFLIYTIYGKSYADIVQFDVAQRRSRRLAQYPGLNSGGTVSPNGKTLALILSRDNIIELYIKSMDGSALRRLTNSPAAEGCPVWSPRGNQICFASDAAVSNRPGLYTIDVPAGNNMHKLQTVGSEAVSPSWSPDDKIVYSAKMGEYTLAVLNLKGGDCDVMTGPIVKAGGSWESPSWAPDNRHIVCQRVTGKRSAIYVVDARTGKFKEIVGGKYNCSMPNWSKLLP